MKNAIFDRKIKILIRHIKIIIRTKGNLRELNDTPLSAA